VNGNLIGARLINPGYDVENSAIKSEGKNIKVKSKKS